MEASRALLIFFSGHLYVSYPCDPTIVHRLLLLLPAPGLHLVMGNGADTSLHIMTKYLSYPEDLREGAIFVDCLAKGGEGQLITINH